MRLCIPAKTDEGRTAKVHEHFGSAPYFTIYDTDKDTVEVISNINQEHTHGACRPMSVLDGKKIDAVICAGMGVRAVLKLNEGGIKAYQASADNADEIIALYNQGSLEEITPEKACNQHNCR